MFVKSPVKYHEEWELVRWAILVVLATALVLAFASRRAAGSEYGQAAPTGEIEVRL